LKRSESEFRNVFEIWDSIGGVVPFKVRRWSWSSCFLVEKTELNKDACVGKMYGKAWGRFVRNGVVADLFEVLGCAGCYQWKIVQ
jgi:hypothetical protein